MGKKKDKEETEEPLWSWMVILLIIILLLLIGFSLFAPMLFTQPSGGLVFDSVTGAIGDTIGGTMTPFVALAGVIVTGLAFYMQLRANQIQIKNFKKQLDAQQGELKLQQNENKLSRFETQFYEMLRLHKENVNEIEIKIDVVHVTHEQFDSGRNTAGRRTTSETIKGRQVFRYFAEEIDQGLDALNNQFDAKQFFEYVYTSFFYGLDESDESDKSRKDMCGVIKGVKKAWEEVRKKAWEKLREEGESKKIVGYTLFEEHTAQLGHYFRHLFHTVKFVASQEEDFISYEDKLKYLRILRAQLSDYEQLVLFYNYLGYPVLEWEEPNSFFSKYRMIHNLYGDKLIKSIVPNYKYLRGELSKLKKTEKLEERKKVSR